MKTPIHTDPAVQAEWGAQDLSKLVHIRARYGAGSVNALIQPDEIPKIVRSVARTLGGKRNPRHWARQALIHGLARDRQMNQKDARALIEMAVWLLQTTAPPMVGGMCGLVLIFDDPVWRDGRMIQSHTHRLVIAPDIGMDSLEASVQ